jgi:hypothetical protein
MISNTDSILCVYAEKHIRVKAYIKNARATLSAGAGDAPSAAFLRGAVQSGGDDVAGTSTSGSGGGYRLTCIFLCIALILQK